MKTLVIFGSPKPVGNTAALLNKVLEQARGEIVTVDAFTANISPCKDCRVCGGDKKCLTDDQMQLVYNAAEDADNIILASPIYFGSLTPPMVSIMSRFQAFFSDFNTLPVVGKRKKGLIILTGGGFGVNGRAENDARLMLKILNAEVVDVVSSLATDRLSAKEDANALEKAQKAARVLFL